MPPDLSAVLDPRLAAALSKADELTTDAAAAAIRTLVAMVLNYGGSNDEAIATVLITIFGNPTEQSPPLGLEVRFGPEVMRIVHEYQGWWLRAEQITTPMGERVALTITLQQIQGMLTPPNPLATLCPDLESCRELLFSAGMHYPELGLALAEAITALERITNLSTDIDGDLPPLW